MSRNYALMRQVLQQIHNEPETWDQTVWASRDSCGTSMCFAGWATYLSGAVPVFRVPYMEGGQDTMRCITREGDERGIPNLAEELLGLEDWDDHLFSGGHDERQLAEIIWGWACDDSELRDEALAEDLMRSLSASDAETNEKVTA